jgi:hypothetical protein
MVKRLLLILKQWNDLLILAPSALVLFIIGDKLIRSIDPTAATIEMGVLSILNWNVFLLLVTGSLAYYLYQLWFGDYFEGNWSSKLNPLQAALINVILWLSTLSLSAYILLRNL